eukprot:Gb_34734 [translate_table: standard]
MDDEEEKKMKWGTWEELVLGSAVKRHGTNNWDLVSFELQARNLSPYVFSPKACKAKYDALQGRFNASKNSDQGSNNSMPWLEELRRLRVAQLKKELQRSNDSIGCLQSKLQKLKAETAQSLSQGAVQCVSGRDPAHTHQHEEDSKPFKERAEADERSKDRSSAGSFTEALEGAETAVWAPPGRHERVKTVCEIDKGDRIERTQMDTNGGPPEKELNPSPALEDNRETSATVRGSVETMPNIEGDRQGNEEKKVVESVSDEAHVPASRTEGYLQQQILKHPKFEVHPSSPMDSFYGSSETLADEREHKRSQHDFVESRNSNFEGCHLGADLVPMVEQKRVDLRSRQRSRRSKTHSSRQVLIPQKPKAEVLDASIREETANQATTNAQDNPEVRSVVKSEPDQTSTGEKMGCTEDSEAHTVDTNASERSSQPTRRRRGRRKHPKAPPFRATDVDSETSRPKHKEVFPDSFVKNRRVEEGSAESTEIGDKTFTGMREGPPGDSDVLSSANPAELSSRQGTKAFSTSHEGSGSAHEQYKECDEYMDAWNQTTRSSGDSHIDRAGSQMEGTDEMSPISRRSRREPKVPGKLLPLLECLRSICSHKFGSLFKHRLESQNKQQYRNVIRRHMDLGMIRSRLEEGSYSGSLEFFRDLLLVFNNALIYYPKNSLEFGAAWVLRQLATKGMASIFQTEALLKQEGPSTRKRDPRKASDPANAVKFNPTSVGIGRKRNARSSGGGRAVGRPKIARSNLEQSSASGRWKGICQKPREQQQFRKGTNEVKEEKIEGYKCEDLKECIEASTSTPVRLKLEVESEQKYEDTNVKKSMDSSKMVAETNAKPRDEAPTTKIFGNSIQIKKSSCFNSDPKKIFSSNSESNKTFNNPLEPRNSSNNSNVEAKKFSSNIGEGSRAMKKEHQILPPSEPIPAKQESAPPTTTHEQTPPIKRGVGRPPKHAKRVSHTQSTPAFRARDSMTPSKARKKARR